IREKYVAHVAKMFELIGETPEAAATDAKTVMTIETDLAKASLTRVERRDPYKIYHKMPVAELAKLTPSFDWQRYLAGIGIPSVKSLNVTQPKFFETVEHELQSVSLPEWKAYLRWHAAHAAAPYLSKQFVTENFNFYSKTLRGVQQQPARWKQCVRAV